MTQVVKFIVKKVDSFYKSWKVHEAIISINMINIHLNNHKINVDVNTKHSWIWLSICVEGGAIQVWKFPDTVVTILMSLSSSIEFEFRKPASGVWWPPVEQMSTTLGRSSGLSCLGTTVISLTLVLSFSTLDPSSLRSLFLFMMVLAVE